MVFSPETVLQQLGGRRFIAMTGAKDFWKDMRRKNIGFRVPRASQGINYVKISYTPRDLYNVEFGRTRWGKKGLTKKVIGRETDVYFDQLQDIFTRHTGLYTRL